MLVERQDAHAFTSLPHGARAALKAVSGNTKRWIQTQLNGDQIS
jgi:hypothetical protein